MERDIQHAICVAWGAHPRVRIWRQNTGAAKINGRVVRFGVVGQPDLCGIIAPEGRWLGIECKAPTGRQSTEQRRFQHVIESMGGVCILARSVDDVDAALAKLGIYR